MNVTPPPAASAGTAAPVLTVDGKTVPASGTLLDVGWGRGPGLLPRPPALPRAPVASRVATRTPSRATPTA